MKFIVIIWITIISYKLISYNKIYKFVVTKFVSCLYGCEGAFVPCPHRLWVWNEERMLIGGIGDELLTLPIPLFFPYTTFLFQFFHLQMLNNLYNNIKRKFTSQIKIKFIVWEWEETNNSSREPMQ